MKRNLCILIIFTYLFVSCATSEFYETKKFDNIYYNLSNEVIKIKIKEKKDTIYEGNEYFIEGQLLPFLEQLNRVDLSDTTTILNYFSSDTKNIVIQIYSQKSKNYLIDKFQSFYIDGKLKREMLMENNEIIYNKNFSLNGIEISSDKINSFFIEPIINIDKIAKCITYPENLLIRNCEARVILLCFINRNGLIEKIKYDSSHEEEFIKEAIKCTLNVEIIPAYYDILPIDCWVSIPISFKLR